MNLRYDIKSKNSKIVGETRDSVLAIYVTYKKTRDFDKGVEDNKKDDIHHIGLDILEVDEERKSAHVD